MDRRLRRHVVLFDASVTGAEICLLGLLWISDVHLGYEPFLGPWIYAVGLIPPAVLLKDYVLLRRSRETGNPTQ